MKTIFRGSSRRNAMASNTLQESGETSLLKFEGLMKSKANFMGGFKKEKTDSHQLEGQPRQKRGQLGSSYTCIYINVYVHIYLSKNNKKTCIILIL